MAKSRWTSKNLSSIASRTNNPSFVLGRMKKGEMNKTEKAYANHLDLRKMAGEVLWWEFEPIKICLAKACFYEIDFLILFADSRLEIHEVKGFWLDDARVKIKVAADKIPIPFVGAKLVKGEWEYEYF